MGEGLETGLLTQLQQPHLQPCLSVQNLLPPQAQADSEYPAPSSPGQLEGKGTSAGLQEFGNNGIVV